MQFIDWQYRVARELGMLATDNVTITDGRVTRQGIKNDINDVWTETLFPILGNQFPSDFEQITYPISTWTATGIVSVTSTGSTLVSTLPIFTNSMEGYQLYNATDEEYRTISTYTDSSTVELEADIDSDWNGDTIYVLGNEFAFGGSMEDLFDIRAVGIKYSSADERPLRCETIKRTEALFQPTSRTVGKPGWYPCTLDIAGKPIRGGGIVPFPTNYNGKLFFYYLEKPPVLVNNTDEIHVRGLDTAIINGAIAKGKRTQGLYDEASQYLETMTIDKTATEVPKGLKEFIGAYRPTSRSGPSRIKVANRFMNRGGR